MDATFEMIHFCADTLVESNTASNIILELLKSQEKVLQSTTSQVSEHVEYYRFAVFIS